MKKKNVHLQYSLVCNWLLDHYLFSKVYRRPLFLNIYHLILSNYEFVEAKLTTM